MAILGKTRPPGSRTRLAKNWLAVRMGSRHPTKFHIERFFDVAGKFGDRPLRVMNTRSIDLGNDR